MLYKFKKIIRVYHFQITKSWLKNYKREFECLQRQHTKDTILEHRNYTYIKGGPNLFSWASGPFDSPKYFIIY